MIRGVLLKAGRDWFFCGFVMVCLQRTFNILPSKEDGSPPSPLYIVYGGH